MTAGQELVATGNSSYDKGGLRSKLKDSSNERGQGNCSSVWLPLGIDSVVKGFS